MSPNTVKTHVVHVLAKLGANDRTQAAARATQPALLGGDGHHETSAPS